MTDSQKRIFVVALLCACLNEAAGQLAVAAAIEIGGPPVASRMPPALRRGTFLFPQAVSAVDVSEDGGFVAVGTMAFRQARNLFLLSAADGKVAWGRNVQPWAPSQLAALSGEGDGERQPAAFAVA